MPVIHHKHQTDGRKKITWWKGINNVNGFMNEAIVLVSYHYDSSFGFLLTLITKVDFLSSHFGCNINESQTNAYKTSKGSQETDLFV